MTPSDPPFPSELVEALRDDAPAIDAAVSARIRARLDVSIGAPAPAAHESGIEQLAPAATAAATRSSLTLVAMGFALGAGAGAAGHALLAPPTVQVVYRDRVVEVPAPAQASAVTAIEAAPPPAPPADTRAAARTLTAAPLPAASASAAAVDDGLSVELGLLDRARKALGNGDAGRALETLQAHTERYPRSRLEQEREALRVKALIAAGRHAEARLQGERFRQRFPKSMLLDSVEKALGSIP